MKATLFFSLYIFLTFLCKGQTNPTSLQANPNPFSERTLLTFSLSSGDTITEIIISSLGQTIITLRTDEVLVSGNYHDSLVMDAYPDGIYFVVLKNKTKNISNTKIIKSHGTGFPLMTDIKEIKVYPNPTSEKIYIEFENGNLFNSQIEVINSSGELILKKTITDAKTLVDVSFLTAGFYYVLIKNKKAHKIIKLYKL